MRQLRSRRSSYVGGSAGAVRNFSTSIPEEDVTIRKDVVAPC